MPLLPQTTVNFQVLATGAGRIPFDQRLEAIIQKALEEVKEEMEDEEE